MKKFAPFLIMTAGCLWGTMGIFVRRLNTMGLSSPTVCAVRAFFTVALMVVFLLVYDRKLLEIKFKDVWIFACGGILSIVFFNVCYFKAIELMSLSAAAILMYMAPVFVLIMSAIFFKESITRIKVISMVAALVGCVLVSGILGGGVKLSWLGLLCGIGSGIGYALYSIFSRVALNRGYNSMTITTYIFLFAAIGGLFIADFGEISGALSESVWPVGYFALYAAVTTVVPYIMYTKGLAFVENSKASIIASVEPVVATVIGFVLYSEKPTVASTIGIVLVLGAIAVLSRNEKHLPNN